MVAAALLVVFIVVTALFTIFNKQQNTSLIGISLTLTKQQN